MISAIQVFSVDPSPTCASSVEIGCDVAAGVSSESTVTLTGLTAGTLYYYRVYGSATVASQRTGTFCFCGSTGLSNSPAAVDLHMFSAMKQDNNVLVKWKTSSTSDAISYQLERSTDGRNFLQVAFLNAVASHEYQFLDQPVERQLIFYRIKSQNPAGRTDISRIITIDLSGTTLIIKPTVVNGVLQIQSAENIGIKILNSTGSLITTNNLKKGVNQIDVSGFSTGIYYVMNVKTREMKVFVISR